VLCKTVVSAEVLAKMFVPEVWRLHGLPKEIVSDRDPRCAGQFWTEVMRLVGTKQSMSTSSALRLMDRLSRLMASWKTCCGHMLHRSRMIGTMRLSLQSTMRGNRQYTF
jgi:hypothetical protein